MGGLVGAIGALGMRVHPFMPIHTFMYILGNLALIWLGLRLFGLHPAFCPAGSPGRAHHHAYPPVAALLTAGTNPALPLSRRHGMGPASCGLVYGVLPFALLSGHAFSGAVLMLIFGLGALPHLLFAQAVAQWLHHSRVPTLLRGLGASVLTGIGILGLWWSFNMTAMPAFYASRRHIKQTA